MKNYIKIDTSVVDGRGVRIVVYFSGCSHHCKGCHNQETWNPELGRSIENLYDELIEVMRTTGLRSITLSGGDPLYGNEDDLLDLIKLLSRVRSHVDSIWMYTGFTYESIVALPIYKEVLGYVDVLVDGRFEKSLRDPSLHFRGSSNQRVIKVPDSIRSERTILMDVDN